jgi:sensor histidine kinase regulating citrate/malate metabolism
MMYLLYFANFVTIHLLCQYLNRQLPKKTTQMLKKTTTGMSRFLASVSADAQVVKQDEEELGMRKLVLAAPEIVKDMVTILSFFFFVVAIVVVDMCWGVKFTLDVFIIIVEICRFETCLCT